jgi:hypothetical protein
MKTYITYGGAFKHFNFHLLNNILNPPLITLQNNVSEFGCAFVGSVSNKGNPNETADKIILSQKHVAIFSVHFILSCLVRQMVVLWAHYHGTPSRPGYFNRCWADKMKELGLIPSASNEVGGRETGQKLRHFIEAGGAFDRACSAFLSDNEAVLYQDRSFSVRAGDVDAVGARTTKAKSKTRFTCFRTGLNAWAKPDAHIFCGCCMKEMQNPDEKD